MPSAMPMPASVKGLPAGPRTRAPFLSARDASGMSAVTSIGTGRDRHMADEGVTARPQPAVADHDHCDPVAFRHPFHLRLNRAGIAVDEYLKHGLASWRAHPIRRARR